MIVYIHFISCLTLFLSFIKVLMSMSGQSHTCHGAVKIRHVHGFHQHAIGTRRREVVDVTFVNRHGYFGRHQIRVGYERC